MTWKTSNGERTLGPAETKLFASCIGTMIDFVRDGDDRLDRLTLGPFERLTDPQKYTVLYDVVVALFTPTDTVPELSAVNENAIWYVFAWLQQQFEDVQCGEEVWGQDVLKAMEELGIKDEVDEEEEEGFLPTLGCEDEEKWRSAIDCLADSILWDRDWEMEDLFPYGSANTAMMQFARIDRNYFRPYQGKARQRAQDVLYRYIRPYCD